MHDEGKNIALGPTRPALVALPLGVNIQGRPGIGMERAESFEGFSRGFESQITTDDSDNVAGGFNLLGLLHRVKRHGTPFKVQGSK
jgi:hypothetical protein